MPPTRVGPTLMSWASQLEESTLAQARQTAAMPFIHPHVALMPDAHSGKGSAVGTVIPTRGAVMPAAVGVDIGCGMIAVRTAFTMKDVERRIAVTGVGLGALRKSVESAIPLSPGHYNRDTHQWDFTAPRIAELESRAAADGVDLAHSPKWRQQLGSLGGGNHFIELCLDESDRVWLFLHSGSRGVGNRIAQHHIRVAQQACAHRHVDLPNRDLAYLTEGTAEFDRYLADLHWAQRFAYLNRAEMMDRFGAVFARWMGTPDHRETERTNCHHNYTRQETHGGEQVWLTRKGAVDAHVGVRAVIPGSMGTHSYVVEGLGNADGLCSAPHGAGRRFSRTEAKRRFTRADLRARMVGIEYRDSAEFIDEIPDAYKDIETVMSDARDLVRVVHELRQILNVKGT
ncbi:RtcB family protein [Rhodococcus sp. NPDC003322]